MKSNIIVLAILCLSLASRGQSTSDSSKHSSASDTLHVGNMLIVTDGKNDHESFSEYHSRRHSFFRPSNVSTNWMIVDLGFANFNDKTNYTTQQIAPGATGDWFNLRTIKSVDVNIWLFMQRLNVIKHVVNLKYGLGIELNNYRFTSPLVFTEHPNTVITYDNDRHFKKDKLAADYVTVPLMLNFNFTPNRREGFGLSVGASAGYLYSARQKLITSEDGKKKTHGNFDLDPWKISYIAELQLGYVKLYGSYAVKNMFKDMPNGTGLNQVPYTVGIRLSNW